MPNSGITQQMVDDARRKGLVIGDDQSVPGYSLGGVKSSGSPTRPPGRRSRKPVMVEPAFTRYPAEAVWAVPLHVLPGDNSRGQKAKIGRAGHERKTVAKQLAKGLYSIAWYAQMMRCGRPLRLTLARLGGRALDPHDNLPASMKYVLDCVCLFLGIEDNNPLLHVKYDQEPGGKVGVRISLSLEEPR